MKLDAIFHVLIFKNFDYTISNVLYGDGEVTMTEPALNFILRTTDYYVRCIIYTDGIFDSRKHFIIGMGDFYSQKQDKK